MKMWVFSEEEFNLFTIYEQKSKTRGGNEYMVQIYLPPKVFDSLISLLYD